MEKQIEKAKQIIETPSKSKKLKFTKTAGEQIKLNEKLVEKTKKLLGIKGYCTNLEEQLLDNQTVIARYHELYKIEQAFRISKTDLQTRPIFHFKEEPIKLHMLICFMALVVSKHIELTTGDSIRKFITECKKITDARMLNKITQKELIVITGGAGGIGTACAKALKNKHLIITDYSQEMVDKAVRNLKQDGFKVSGIACDITDKTDIENLKKFVADNNLKKVEAMRSTRKGESKQN